MSRQYTEYDIPEIPLEHPVLLDDPRGKEEFNNALLKAKLLYDEINPSDVYQYAILYSKDNQEYSVAYNSEIDGKTYIRKMDCTVAYHADQLPLSNLSKGFIRVTKMMPVYIDSKEYTNHLQGLLSHNGRTIVPTKYQALSEIGQSLIISTLYETQTHDLYDKAGNIILSHTGILLTTPYLNIDMGDEIAPIIMLDEHIKDKNGTIKNKEKLIRICMIYKGSLWKISQIMSKSPGQINVYRNTIELMTHEKGPMQYDVQIIRDIMEKIDYKIVYKYTS